MGIIDELKNPNNVMHDTDLSYKKELLETSEINPEDISYPVIIEGIETVRKEAFSMVCKLMNYINTEMNRLEVLIDESMKGNKIINTDCNIFMKRRLENEKKEKEQRKSPALSHTDQSKW